MQYRISLQATWPCNSPVSLTLNFEEKFIKFNAHRSLDHPLEAETGGV